MVPVVMSLPFRYRRGLSAGSVTRLVARAARPHGACPRPTTGRTGRPEVRQAVLPAKEAQHREHASVAVDSNREVELVEDVRHVLLHGTHADLESLRDGRV